MGVCYVYFTTYARNRAKSAQKRGVGLHYVMGVHYVFYVHSDQGRQFESELVSEVCKLLGIHKSRTTPYHPQSDGMVERFNCTLLSMLATLAFDQPFDWEDHLRPVCLAYNTSVHSTTGHTPFYLMFGHQDRKPIEVMYGSSDFPQSSPSEYAN